MTFPDFLSKEAPEVVIPVGGTFEPSGLIGRWLAGMAYEFAIQADSALLVEELAKIGVSFRTPESSKRANLILRTESQGWCWFRGADYGLMTKVIEGLDIRNQNRPEQLQRPSSLWQFECPRDSLVNVAPENVEKFNDPVVMTATAIGYGSAKARHELHLIALPAAVCAYAKALGYDVPDYDLSELLDIGRGTIATDELQRELIGSWVDEEGPKRAKYKNTEGGWQKSILGQRRAELWAALGEEDVARSRPTPKDESGKPHPEWCKQRQFKTCTASPKLSECLNILALPWSSPVWARVHSVPDPRVDNFYTTSGPDGNEVVKRRTVPALVEMFESKAQAAAGGGAEPTGSAPTSGPQVPEVYEKYPDVWAEQIEKFKAVMPEGPPPVIIAAIEKNPSFKGIDPDEVMAWL